MNSQLFFDCLNHPEPLIDPYYCLEERVISVDPGSPPTQIMILWAEVRDRITAIGLAMHDGENAVVRRNIERLDETLGRKYANYLEFTSFFPALDVSYSSYRKLDREDRLNFLLQATSEFITKRHTVYMAHGYSPVTIQVRRDFEKHKTGGSAAKRKVEAILEDLHYTLVSNVEDFFAGRSYVHAQGVLYDAIEIWLRERGLRFGWRAAHQNKLPDVLVNTGNGFLLVECKHMKEGGGGQDKQLAELIAFVGESEDSCTRDFGCDVGYVAFLDGVLFNELRQPRAKKTIQQKSDIVSALARNPQNYFVNTWGFIELLR